MRGISWGFFLFYSNFLIAADTELQFYRPFTQTDKQPQANIVEVIEGTCFKQSLLITREDAWECEAKGKTYDPCFLNPNRPLKELLCPKSPWNSESILIKIPDILDTSYNQTLDMSRTYPWAIELSDAVRCQAIANNDSYDNLPIRYHCNDQSILVGHLQRCKATWSILRYKQSAELDTAEINKAWF